MDKYFHDLLYEHNELISIGIAYQTHVGGVHSSRTIYNINNVSKVQVSSTSDYLYLDWYQIPYHKKAAVWTEPWFDEGGSGKYVISYCKPIFEEGNVVGIIRFDTDLAYLQSIVSPLKLKKSGSAFLISNTGTIITHPADSLIMDESIFSIAEQGNDPSLRELV